MQVLEDDPQEKCDLQPTRVCNEVVKLVPALEPKQKCVNVPREICVRMRVNPKKVKKPVVREWCADDDSAFALVENAVDFDQSDITEENTADGGDAAATASGSSVGSAPSSPGARRPTDASNLELDEATIAKLQQVKDDLVARFGIQA